MARFYLFPFIPRPALTILLHSFFLSSVVYLDSEALPPPPVYFIEQENQVLQNHYLGKSCPQTVQAYQGGFTAEANSPAEKQQLLAQGFS